MILAARFKKLGTTMKGLLKLPSSSVMNAASPQADTVRISPDLDLHPTYTLCGRDERGFYVRNGDNPLLCVPYTMFSGICKGLSEDLDFPDQFDCKNRESIRDSATLLANAVETEALLWT